MLAIGKILAWERFTSCFFSNLRILERAFLAITWALDVRLRLRARGFLLRDMVEEIGALLLETENTLSAFLITSVSTAVLKVF